MYFVAGAYLVIFLFAYGYLAWNIIVDGIMTGQLTLFAGLFIFIIGGLFILLFQAIVTPLFTPLAWLAEGLWWLMKKAWHGIHNVISHRTQA